jgi:hypothetical protein
VDPQTGLLESNITHIRSNHSGLDEIGSLSKLTAHFDGKVLVPDSSVKLPVNQPLKISVSPVEANGAEDDMDEGAWLRVASQSPACDF